MEETTAWTGSAEQNSMQGHWSLGCNNNSDSSGRNIFHHFSKCPPSTLVEDSQKKAAFGSNIQKLHTYTTCSTTLSHCPKPSQLCVWSLCRWKSELKWQKGTYSLIIWGCRKSLRFWISRLIFPTTSRLRIFCLLSIFTATLCPVSWCSPTIRKRALQSHKTAWQDSYKQFRTWWFIIKKQPLTGKHQKMRGEIV